MYDGDPFPILKRLECVIPDSSIRLWAECVLVCEVLFGTALKKSREYVYVRVADLSGHFYIELIIGYSDMFAGFTTNDIEPAGIFPFDEVM